MSTGQQVNPEEVYELCHLENVQKWQTGCPQLAPSSFSTHFLILDSVTENSDVKWLEPWLSQLSACLTHKHEDMRSIPSDPMKGKTGYGNLFLQSQGWETEAGASLGLIGKSTSPTW